MSQPAAALFRQTSVLPADFISGYEILDTQNLAWPVALYRLERIDKRPPTHEDRGGIKNAVWELYRENKSRCRGYGFVIDINKDLVAVPEGWKIPSGINHGDYQVVRERSLVASAANPLDEKIIAGILREAFKKQFKDNVSDYLGCLWQDMDKFCQLPKPKPGEEYCMCRRFGTTAKLLRGNKWVVQTIVGTATIDGKTLYEYYVEGHVDVLARMIQLKRGTKVDRRNQPIAVRVLQDASDDHHIKVRALEISDPSMVIRHGNLSSPEQKALSGSLLACSQYKREPEEIPLHELRLILDSQITQEEHSETIVEPEDREVFMRHLRELMNGAEVYGHKLCLAEMPFDTSYLKQGFIFPPSVRVIGNGGKEVVLPAPTIESEDFLRKRFRDRADHVRRNGFLQSRPINPVVMWPKHFGDPPSRRMLSDLNHILGEQDAAFRFESGQYENVEDIRRVIDAAGYDALLAVLPEGRLAAHSDKSTHEFIKQRIEVPSQCIHFDHTLPRKWTTKAHAELVQTEPRLARRIQQRYELCILSLLVKHHWVPFAPADPFAFNVQIGLDVGGTHNTDAVSCIGYGFRKPQEGLIFRPDEIPIDVQKAEPIPTHSLYAGLLRQFEVMRYALISAGRVPDFDRVLFYRDGPLHGDGDAWNEKDAITDLHRELLKRGWVTDASVWTATEIMKFAEGWRLFRGEAQARNPLAGRYVFAFDDEDVALVCTTGDQSLTQGTACPLMVRIVDIYGQSNRLDVIQDLIWQADMCFTKPDVGMRLPWVLHVADVGALQQSRSYLITGITA